MKKQPSRRRKEPRRDDVRFAVDLIPIDDISHAEYNPMKMTRTVIDDVKASIMEFGFVDPVVVNIREWEGDRLVMVGGHKRHIAIRELRDAGVWKESTIPCVLKRLSPEEEIALNVALNKIHDDFDPEKLALVMEEIRVKKPGMVRVTGFKEKELTGLFKHGQAKRGGDAQATAERMLDGGKAAPSERYLYMEPRNEQEFDLVHKTLGIRSDSRELSMDKVMQVLGAFVLSGERMGNVIFGSDGDLLKQPKQPRRRARHE